MRIVRLREPNCNQDNELQDTDLRKPRERQPKSPKLLAIIAELRQRYSTKTLERSKTLIEDSRRLIFETGLRIIKDD